MTRPDKVGFIDLAIRTKGATLPTVAVELKGGAYSHRNSLTEVICPNGYCNDMSKLAPLNDFGVDTWFICVDMVTLGRAVAPTEVSKIWAQCREHGLNFAYFSQDEKTCQIGRADSRTLQTMELPAATANAQPSARIRDVLEKAVQQDALAETHERNIQGALYRGFVATGWTPACIAVEMFSGFRKDDGGNATKRTDMAIFGPNVNGHFNLHRNGQRGNSNDGHKARNLLGVFEIKGGSSFARKNAAAKRKDVSSDLVKLAEQREGMMRNGADNPEAWLVICDGREGLPDTVLQHIVEPYSDLNVIYHDPVLGTRIFNGGTGQPCGSLPNTPRSRGT